MNNVKFSIVTVCFNAIDSIESTIKSVLEQNYKDFEYIIIDGYSNDGTVDIIEDYAKNNECIIFISEKDRGIYDAMNKAINLATNELIYFLNSGDTFCNKDVLGNISNKYNGEDIIYGNIVINDKVIRGVSRINKLFLIREKMICHQAIFSKLSVFKTTGMFDIKYRFCADRKWLIKAFKNKFLIKYIDINICNYDINGVSSSEKNMVKLYKESIQIIKDEFGKIIYIIVYIKRKVGNLRRNIKL